MWRQHALSAKPSSSSHPIYIEAEKLAGRLLGLIPKTIIPNCQIIPTSLIPKHHQPGNWRLIIDLSFPHGYSINDGINPTMCSMEYATIDQAVRTVQSLGKGTLLSKLDLKRAYRMVPIYIDDQPLLGISWEGAVYLDTALTFGLSAKFL